MNWLSIKDAFKHSPWHKNTRFFQTAIVLSFILWYFNLKWWWCTLKTSLIYFLESFLSPHTIRFMDDALDGSQSDQCLIFDDQIKAIEYGRAYWLDSIMVVLSTFASFRWFWWSPTLFLRRRVCDRDVMKPDKSGYHSTCCYSHPNKSLPITVICHSPGVRFIYKVVAAARLYKDTNTQYSTSLPHINGTLSMK